MKSKVKIVKVVIVATVLILLIPFLVFMLSTPTPRSIPAEFAQLQDGRSFAINAKNAQDLKKFRDIYNLPDANHSFGFIDVAGESIALHSFSPDSSKGYILTVHGYFDNCGIQKNLIDWAVYKGYTIVLPDLPGHGLSSGERANISDFRIYREVVLATLQTIPEDDKKIHLIGHSTGCTPIVQLLAEDKKCWSGETILVAPLIRSAHWNVSKFGSAILSPFKERTARLFRNCSHDEAFKKFQREEPLHMNSLPTAWFKALVKWNRELEEYNSFSDARVIAMQGTEDGTVDWKYNMSFLKEKLSNFTMYTIPEGRHQLMNESEEYRTKVFELLEKVLL